MKRQNPKARRQRAEGAVVEITKYENRRLYDSVLGRYITYGDVVDMVRSGYQIMVMKKKTGEDITHQVLLGCVAQEKTTVMTKDELHQIVKRIPVRERALDGAGEH